MVVLGPDRHPPPTLPLSSHSGQKLRKGSTRTLGGCSVTANTPVDPFYHFKLHKHSNEAGCGHNVIFLFADILLFPCVFVHYYPLLWQEVNKMMFKQQQMGQNIPNLYNNISNNNTVLTKVTAEDQSQQFIQNHTIGGKRESQHTLN